MKESGYNKRKEDVISEILKEKWSQRLWYHKKKGGREELELLQAPTHTQSLDRVAHETRGWIFFSTNQLNKSLLQNNIKH